MMPEEFSVQPPHIRPPHTAVWLIGLFVSDQDAEAVPGDLLEEFSHLASKSGVAFARRWYWRQTAKTVAQLAVAAFRGAPWWMTAVILAGFWLRGFASGLPDKFLSVVTDRYLTFWSAHLHVYLWVLNGVGIAHIVAALLVGCAVALAAKGREMAATMVLALFLCALIGPAWAWAATHGLIGGAWMLWSCADPLAIVLGGVIVRTRRLQNRESSLQRLGMTRV